MKKLIVLAITILLFVTPTLAKPPSLNFWSINSDGRIFPLNDRQIIGTIQTLTVADSGDANPAAANLDPTSKYIEITCNDVHTCDITLQETSAFQQFEVTIINISANVVDFADTAGITELVGAFAAGQYDTLTLIYISDRWIEKGRSDN